MKLWACWKWQLQVTFEFVCGTEELLCCVFNFLTKSELMFNYIWKSGLQNIQKASVSRVLWLQPLQEIYKTGFLCGPFQIQPQYHDLFRKQGNNFCATPCEREAIKENVQIFDLKINIFSFWNATVLHPSHISLSCLSISLWLDSSTLLALP